MSPLVLLLALALALGTGWVAGWWLRGRRHRGALEAEAALWEGRFVAQVAEAQAAGRRASQLGDELKQLRSRLGTAEAGLAAAQTALDARTTEHDQLRRALAVREEELAARDRELVDLRRQVAELGSVRRTLEDRDAAIERGEARRASLAQRIQDLTRERGTLDSERMRLVVRVETLEAELRGAADTARRERETQRKALAAANALVERSRREVEDLARRLASFTSEVERLSRERDVALAAAQQGSAATRAADARCRELELRLQELAAERSAALGALEARAERVDPLVRQVEDRDALLQAALFERDAAQRRVRESAARVESLESEVNRLAREARAGARAPEAAEGERQAGSIGRERDEARAEARRLALELETARAELRERDRRFRSLAADNERVVRELTQRVHELEADLVSGATVAGTSRGEEGNGAPPADGADDLTAIRGIGPVLARRLAEHGVTTFSQVASWSDEDIERMGRLLGAFPDRIRRDAWVAGARAAHERKYGRPL
jgi:predicted flap endonuclease-1-like 5' DNA nuclease